MRRILTVIVCLASALSLFAEEATWVKLTLADEREQSYIVPATMTIKWSVDSLYLSSPFVEAAYLRSDVKGYSFSTLELTGDDITLPELLSDYTVVWESAGRVVIYGVPDNAVAEVYSINAMKQTVPVSRSADALRIDLTALPRGIFIISVKGIPPFKVKL